MENTQYLAEFSPFEKDMLQNPRESQFGVWEMKKRYKLQRFSY
jgi:hypothetical protein